MIKIDKDLCIGCGQCEDICSTGAITVNKMFQKAQFNKYKCAECGACIDNCEYGALSFELYVKNYKEEILCQEKMEQDQAE